MKYLLKAELVLKAGRNIAVEYYTHVIPRKRFLVLNLTQSQALKQNR